MKLMHLSVSVAIVLLTSITSYAGDGFFTKLARNIGYGISDGYHAQRDCLPDYASCSNCSPMQQPMTPVPMMQQPMMAPAYSQGAPQPFQQVSDPVTYPVTQAGTPWQQPYAPGHGQPATPSVAFPHRIPVAHW